MIAFVIVLFLIMFIASGMAIDFMRHETARADLQNALDRGVLAAADLTQTAQNDPNVSEQDIVADYMKSRSFNPAQMSLAVRTPNIGFNSRRIEAEASYELNTYFLKLLGMPTMRVPALASAQQHQTDTEIALVLDVSGSMTWESEETPGEIKLDLLQDAAHEFVDTLIDNDTRSRTMMTIVPYSDRSSVGPALAARLNMEMHHGYSHCIEWDANDMASTAASSVRPRIAGGVFGDDGSIDGQAGHNGYYVPDPDFDGVEPNYSGRLQQSQHFWQSSYWQELGCYGDHGDAIAMTNNNSDLHTMIDSLVAQGATATYNGIRTAAMFLDPSTRPIMNDMITDGERDAALTDWPRDFNTQGVRKVVVIMTDGQNTNMFKVPEPTYNIRTPQGWDGMDAYPVRVPEVDNVATIDMVTGRGDGDERMKDICDTLKAQGVLVYTIGFELGSANSRQAQALAVCGSSPSSNYLANGVQISAAFRAIASDIKNLKLVN